MGDVPRENLLANKSSTEIDDDKAIDDGILAGSLHVTKALDMIRADQGGQAAMGYAGGMVGGIRAWLVTNYGAEDTRLLFLHMAETPDEMECVGVMQ